MLCFTACVYDGGGIVGDGGICWWLDWDREGLSPGGDVSRKWFDDADEVVVGIVVGDVQ